MKTEFLFGRWIRVGALVSLAWGLSACSMVSSLTTIELVKSAGTVAGAVATAGDGTASHTVHHGDPAPTSVCIRLNRDVAVADLVSALQGELKARGVESRVYEGEVLQWNCRVQLSYTATVEWDQPPFGSEYRPFMNTAQLTLRREDGRVMSSSRYEVGLFGVSKWASTRKKIGPAVQALLTGFEG